MLSYHNKPAVKAKYIARYAAHRVADEVIQGLGFANGRGCFVGCTLDKYDHELFPVELGWPEWLARLADTIFEGLPKSQAPAFGTDLLTAVPVGVDLDKVRIPFLLAVQRRNLARLADTTATCADDCRNAIQGVIDWLESGGESGERQTVARAAVAAAARAAEWPEAAALEKEAAEAAAWAAAAARAEWAASAAGWAAWAAAAAAKWPVVAEARTKEYQAQRDDLLSIIRGLA